MTVAARRLVRLLTLVLALVPAGAFAASGRVVVIGATAASAPDVIGQALKAGYTVTGLARRPEAVKINAPGFTVAKGDVLDVASLAAVMTGRETVVSLIGPRVDYRTEIKEMDLYTTGTANIVAAMKQKGNRRLIVTSSVGAEEVATAPPPDQTPNGGNLGQQWLWNARLLYGDMARMEKAVAASGLDVVILHPGFMVAEPARHNLKSIVGAPTPRSRIITYADFGAFVVKAIGDKSLTGKTVGLYSDDKMDWGKNLDFDALEKARKAQAGEK